MVSKGMKRRVLFINGSSPDVLRAFSGQGDDEYGWRYRYDHEYPRKMELLGVTIDIVRFEGDDMIKNLSLSGYSIVCLCLHRYRAKEILETLVARCRRNEAVPIGVADSTKYDSERVVPEIEGLIRCLSDDLPRVIESYLQ